MNDVILSNLSKSCNYFDRLMRSTAKVLKEAEKFIKLGDDENAYIMYMKYFNLLEIIRKKKDYSKYKRDQLEHLGRMDDIRKRMDFLEELDLSLRER